VDGGAGHDTLWGAAPGAADTDVDILNGGEGDDTLHLGAGDYGHGGAGADSFTLQDFGPGAPLMQITDFDPAEDDLVVIYDSALHPDPQLSLTAGNGATLLLLDGVPLASLTAGANIDLAAIRLQAA
jgi:Ca2+-binding RTX toxin-like protein